MSTAVTSFKLGLLTLACIAAVLVTAVAFGVRGLSEETVHYHTYFDESVQGLEVGSPVKYRGVSVGSVARIEIGPDRRHVDVVAAFKLRDIRRLGLTDSGARPDEAPGTLRVPPDLRAQLGSQGITGVKFVNIDFFDVETNPPPPLPFQPAPNHIPAAASLMKGLEDNLSRIAERLPDLIETSAATLRKVEHTLDEFDEQQVPAKLVHVLDEVRAAVQDLRVVVRSVDRARIPEKAARTIDHLDTAVESVNRVLARFDGDAGLVASTQRATDAVGDLGRSASGSTEELERTLRDLGEAARAIRDLADLIERDPDALVKGRAPRRSR